MVFDNARFGSPPDDATLDSNPYATHDERLLHGVASHMVAAGLGSRAATG